MILKLVALSTSIAALLFPPAERGCVVDPSMMISMTAGFVPVIVNAVVGLLTEFDVALKYVQPLSP